MIRIGVAGAAGHGREVLASLAALADSGAALGSVDGFLDDDPALAGTVIGDLPVLGPLRDAAARVDALVLGVGYPEVKARVVERLGDGDPGRWPAVIHPHASLGARIAVERGSLVQAGAVLSADVTIGAFVTVNLGATISHDCALHDFATVSPGASLGGAVVVEEGAFIGIGACVIQGVRIGAWSVVAAGAAVVEDVPPAAVVGGVPARLLRQRDPGWWRAE